MADQPDPRLPNDIPEAVAVPKRRWTMQWVWLLPVLAAVVGGWLAVRAVLQDGPDITIHFKTAEGLEPNKTRVKYKDVDIGVVKSVTLSPDRAGIVVKAALSKSADELLVEDTRFWVVRARIAGGTVSGITTLFSGSYIGMDPGKSKESRRDFDGLETPPVITTGLQGKQFVLRARDIGSLDVGSPVYFRRLEAGRVIAYELDKEGTEVLLRVFVNAPYDQYVSGNTRFWHASGIDVALDANGLRINTESLASVVVGGLAFQAPDGTARQPPVTENAVFTLHDNRVQAMKDPITFTERYALTFRESVRGLGIGSPVDFNGLVVGEVKVIDASFDRTSQELAMRVEIDFYPQRMFRGRIREPNGKTQDVPSLSPLVARGMRAQLRSANLLTGQQYIALEFVKGNRKGVLDVSTTPPEIPTVPGAAQELQATIASIARKLDGMQLDQIGTDLRSTLQSATKVLGQVEQDLAPAARDTLLEGKQVMIEGRQTLAEARKALADARKAVASIERTVANAEPLPLEASEALREIGRAAQSFRVLADYLERHPEAVIRGKRPDAR